MADVKFTGLPAGSAPFDDGSLIAISDFDGATTYTSQKITLTQAKAIFGNAPTSTDNAIAKFNSTTGQLQNSNVIVSDDGSVVLPSSASGTPAKFIFDSSGTNKVVMDDLNSTCQIDFNSSSENDINITADNGAYAEGWAYISSSQSSMGFGSGASEYAFICNSTQVRFSVGGTNRIVANSTGLGFFNTTPASRPTGVAVTAGGIHAALVTLGLITA